MQQAAGPRHDSESRRLGLSLARRVTASGLETAAAAGVEGPSLPKQATNPRGPLRRRPRRPLHQKLVSNCTPRPAGGRARARSCHRSRLGSRAVNGPRHRKQATNPCVPRRRRDGRARRRDLCGARRLLSLLANPSRRAANLNMRRKVQCKAAVLVAEEGPAEAGRGGTFCASARGPPGRELCQ